MSKKCGYVPGTRTSNLLQNCWSGAEMNSLSGKGRVIRTLGLCSMLLCSKELGPAVSPRLALLVVFFLKKVKNNKITN